MRVGGHLRRRKRQVSAAGWLLLASDSRLSPSRHCFFSLIFSCHQSSILLFVILPAHRHKYNAADHFRLDGSLAREISALLNASSRRLLMTFISLAISSPSIAGCFGHPTSGKIDRRAHFELPKAAGLGTVGVRLIFKALLFQPLSLSVILVERSDIAVSLWRLLSAVSLRTWL